MRSIRLLVLALVAAVPAAAFAHGGDYSPPADPPGGGGPGSGPGGGGGGGPQVPPGTADPPAAATRWETWWAANKEFYLRLNVAMRTDDGPLTRGASAGKPSAGPRESAVEIRARQDASVREALVPLFVEALADDHFEVRTAAAIALGKSGSNDGSKPLRIAAVKDKHKQVRESAILGLGLLGRPGDIPFLDGVLHDAKEDTRCRAFAAFALGLIGGDDAATALLGFADGRPGAPGTFRNESPALISSTFVAMGLTGDAGVLPALRHALTSPAYDDNVRAFVVLSLGRLKDRDSMPYVVRLLLTEKDVGVRRSAAISAGRTATPGDPGAIDALVSAVRGDRDPVVRQFAAISLGEIGGPAVAARLEKLFTDRSAEKTVRPFLAIALALAKDVDAVPALREAFAAETDESMKSSYCIALGMLADRDSVPLIEKQVVDRGRFWLQGYAALSLGIMRNHPSADLLFQRLTSETEPRLRANLAVALGLLHDPRARTYLVGTLHQQDATLYERGGAAMAMGVLRMNEAVTDIVDVYRDKKEQDLVRAFSIVALGLIADPSPVPKLSRFAIDNNYTLAIDPLNEVLSIL